MIHGLVRNLEKLQDAYPGLFGFMNWAPGGMGAFLALVRSELGLRPGLRILDLGCGRGAFTTIFDQQGYLGVDLSPSLVTFARGRYPGYAYAVMDGARLGLHDAWFDAVLVVGVLHHLNDQQAADALAEIRRVLKPGGVTLVVEPIPTVSRWNLIGRILKSLDLGQFIRSFQTWSTLIGSTLALQKAYCHRIGTNDLAVMVAERT